MNQLDYKATEILPSGELTSSYVASPIIIGASQETTELLYTENQMMLYLAIADLGNMTSVQLKIEFSNDQTTWYQETFESITGGTATDTLGEHTFGAAGNYRIGLPLKDRYVKISYKGSGGTGTGSDVSCIAIYGTA